MRVAYTDSMSYRLPVIETIDEDMVEILRQKTPSERLEVAFSMWRFARDMVTAMLVQEHPDWSRERIEAEVALRMSHGAC